MASNKIDHYENPLIPLLAGLYLSFIDFSWLRLFLMILLVILAFPVVGFVRGNLACRYCKQRELGCPAAKLFGGKQTSQSHQPLSDLSFT